MGKDGVLDAGEQRGLFFPETHDGVLDIVVKEAMRQKDKDGDGKLNGKEFWDTEQSASEDESSEFAQLDKNNDGFIDAEELRPWESGRFHTEDSMQKMFDVVDKDRDMHVTAEELAAARKNLASTDASFANYHFLEWAQHHEL